MDSKRTNVIELTSTKLDDSDPVNIDANLADADWPKRTNDTIAAHKTRQQFESTRNQLTPEDEEKLMKLKYDLPIELGGSGSGNFGHAGRPGEVGGSGAGGEILQAPANAKGYYGSAVGMRHIKALLEKRPMTLESLASHLGKSVSATRTNLTYMTKDASPIGKVNIVRGRMTGKYTIIPDRETVRSTGETEGLKRTNHAINKILGVDRVQPKPMPVTLVDIHTGKPLAGTEPAPVIAKTPEEKVDEKSTDPKHFDREQDHTDLEWLSYLRKDCKEKGYPDLANKLTKLASFPVVTDFKKEEWIGNHYLIHPSGKLLRLDDFHESVLGSNGLRQAYKEGFIRQYSSATDWTFKREPTFNQLDTMEQLIKKGSPNYRSNRPDTVSVNITDDRKSAYKNFEPTQTMGGGLGGNWRRVNPDLVTRWINSVYQPGFKGWAFSLDMPIELGDVSGHEFHGNQWSEGLKSGANEFKQAIAIPPEGMKQLHEAAARVATACQKASGVSQKLVDHATKFLQSTIHEMFDGKDKKWIKATLGALLIAAAIDIAMASVEPSEQFHRREDYIEYISDGVAAAKLYHGVLSSHGHDYAITLSAEDGFDEAMTAGKQLWESLKAHMAKKELSLMVSIELADASAAEGQWITIHGSKVFIKDGQSIKDAVSDHFKAMKTAKSNEPAQQALQLLKDNAKGIAHGYHVGHDNQVHRGTLIDHTERVMNKLQDPVLKTIAALHDAVEDTGISVKDIRTKFGDRVANAVQALSMPSELVGKEYLDHIQNSVCKNPDAVKVKMADIADNTRVVKDRPPIIRSLEYTQALIMLGRTQDPNLGHMPWESEVTQGGDIPAWGGNGPHKMTEEQHNKAINDAWAKSEAKRQELEFDPRIQKVVAGIQEKYKTISSKPAAERTDEDNAYLKNNPLGGLKGDNSILHHIGLDGKITPERLAFHKAIIDKVVDGAIKSDKPTYTVLGGGMGAGKSTLLGSGLVQIAPNSVKIDVDTYKVNMPEYKALIAAGAGYPSGYVHEECSMIGAEIQANLIKKGASFVQDGCGNTSVKKLGDKIERAHQQGYRVDGIYVTVPTQMAVDRTISRAKGNGPNKGRFIPETAVREVHRDISQIYPKMAHEPKMRTFDLSRLFDSSGGIKHVATSMGTGDLQINNGRLWKAFIEKGKE